MVTGVKDLALCVVIVSGVGAAYWATESLAFHVPPTRLEAPPAPNPPVERVDYEIHTIEKLRQITPPGEPAPPPPGVSPDELETRAA